MILACYENASINKFIFLVVVNCENGIMPVTQNLIKMQDVTNTPDLFHLTETELFKILRQRLLTEDILSIMRRVIMFSSVSAKSVFYESNICTDNN